MGKVKHREREGDAHTSRTQGDRDPESELERDSESEKESGGERARTDKEDIGDENKTISSQWDKQYFIVKKKYRQAEEKEDIEGESGRGRVVC